MRVEKLGLGRLCRAHTQAGGWCRAYAMAGSTCCIKHGATGGRPRGIRVKPEQIAVMVEGRRRWVERMRVAKAAGLIARFPCGARSLGLPPLSKDPKVRKAQRLIEARMAERSHQVAAAAAPQPAPADLSAERPWAGLSKGEKLAASTDRALDVVKAYLDLPVDPSNWKLAAMQASLALGVIGYQIRVESAALTDRSEKPADPPPQISVHFVSADSAPEKMTTELPRIVTMAEYEALTSGRRFIAADGSERIKP